MLAVAEQLPIDVDIVEHNYISIVQRDDYAEINNIIMVHVNNLSLLISALEQTAQDIAEKA